MNQLRTTNPFAVTRRHALAGIGCATFATAGFARSPAVRQKGYLERHNLPIGVQFYTVQDQAKIDLDGTLNGLKNAGFQTVELASLLGYSTEHLRNAGEAAGLRFTSIHVRPVASVAGDPSLLGTDRQLIDACHGLGIKTIVAAGRVPPEVLSQARLPAKGAVGPVTANGEPSAEEWQRIAAFMTKRGEFFKREGLRLAYHNGRREFVPVGGTTGFDILVRETNPRHVAFELDLGWAAIAGQDPVALLRRMAGRTHQIHMKDVSATKDSAGSTVLTPAPLGSGNGGLPWDTILREAYASGVREYYIEQEPPYLSNPIDTLGNSVKFLKAIA